MNSQDTQQPKTSRYAAIDALRGLAALLVVVIHVSIIFLNKASLEISGHGIKDFFLNFDLGRIGITIFFIISGFVICKSFNRKKKELKSFVLKRFFRLYPLFWLSVLLSWLFIWRPNPGSLTPNTLLANLTMLPAFLGQEFMIGLYWSLETELIFYVLAAILYAIGWLRKPLVLVGLTLLMYALSYLFITAPGFQPSLPHWTATPYHLALMLFGVTMRYAYEGEKSQSKFSHTTWVKIQLGLLLLIPLYITAEFLLTGNSTYVTDAYAYLTGITLFLLGLKFLKRAPGWMVHIGVVSYSIYLLHPIVFALLLKLTIKYSVLQGYHISVYIIVNILMSIALASLTYKLVEEPFNNLGRKLSA